MSLPDADKSIVLSDSPYLCDIAIHQNATFWWKGQLTYTDEAGVTVNVNLIGATTKKFCLETSAGVDTLFDLVNLTADGKFEILLTAAQTAALAIGSYRYDCDIVLPVGNPTFPAGISLRIFRGIATVHEEISG